MKFVRSVAVLAMVLGGFASGVAQAQAKLNCVCLEANCGKGGTEGVQGDIFADVEPDAVKSAFKPKPKTGWACVVPPKASGSGGPKGCFCQGKTATVGCGADEAVPAIGGLRNEFGLGLSPEEIDKNYGGGKAGNKTGWLCGNVRDPAASAK